MAKKEEKKMDLLKVTELKQKQEFLDMTTFQDCEVIVECNRFSPGKDAAENLDAAINASMALFSSKQELLEGLCSAASSKSYADGKAQAISGRNLMLPETKSDILSFLKLNAPAYKDLKRSDAWERFSAALKAGNPAALKVVKIVTVKDSEFANL